MGVTKKAPSTKGSPRRIAHQELRSAQETRNQSSKERRMPYPESPFWGPETKGNDVILKREIPPEKNHHPTLFMLLADGGEA